MVLKLIRLLQTSPRTSYKSTVQILWTSSQMLVPVEETELSDIADGNVKWHKHFETI